MILAAVIGIAVGVVVGALGAGGGILSVPILVYILGEEAHQATAASLVIVILTALVSIVPHARGGRVQWRDGLIFAAISTVGSFVGARVSAVVNPNALMLSFGILMALVAVAMLFRTWQMRRNEGVVGPAPEGYQVRPLAIILPATVTGLLTGFFGVGGGFVVVPMLILVLKFPASKATGTSLIIMIIASAVGLAGRIGTGIDLTWDIAIAFAAGSMFGGLFGARITERVKDSTLTLAFGLLLVGISALTLFETLWSITNG